VQDLKGKKSNSNKGIRNRFANSRKRKKERKTYGPELSSAKRESEQQLYARYGGGRKGHANFGTPKRKKERSLLNHVYTKERSPEKGGKNQKSQWEKKSPTSTPKHQSEKNKRGKANDRPRQRSGGGADNLAIRFHITLLKARGKNIPREALPDSEGRGQISVNERWNNTPQI